MESSVDWFDPPLVFSLPPCFFFFFIQRWLPHLSSPKKKSQSRSLLASRGPSAGWLIVEVSLCQMTNRVSLPVANLPAGAQPQFVYSPPKQGNTKTHPPFLFPLQHNFTPPERQGVRGVGGARTCVCVCLFAHSTFHDLFNIL